MTRDQPRPGADEHALLLTGVRKAYPGVQAVRDVSLTRVYSGEVHALVGENGAGKSTLMGIASGNIRADSGTVEIMGRRLLSAHPSRARDLGLAIAYQDDSLAPDLTVAENLLLSAPRPTRVRFSERNSWASQSLSIFASPIEPRVPVRELSLASRQMVEIVKAVESQPRVLLLDEPTAALPPSEVDRLHAVLRRLADEGVAVVYITHRLHEVTALCDCVSVMRDGEMVEEALPTASTSEDQLVALMVGRAIGAFFPDKPPASPGGDEAPAVLEVVSVSAGKAADVTFDVRPGEIVGLAGIDGNGQHDVIRTAAGLVTRSTGTISVDGRVVPPNSVARARSCGLVYISGDRRGESLFSTLNVRENLSAGNLERSSSMGIVSQRAERRTVAQTIDALQIRTRHMEQNVQQLSGGNQQKVALGRAFIAEPKVYLVEEPTQGVDAGARAEIYRLLRDAAMSGGGVLVLSSDAVELTGLCDRVLVFVRGQIARELTGDALTHDSIVETAVRTEGTTRDPDVTDTPTAAGAYRYFLQWTRRSDFAPIALLLVTMLALAFAVSLTQPTFMSRENVGNLLFLSVPLGFAALGQACVMLIGGIDLSIGPVIALTTVALAQIMRESDMRRDGLAMLAAVGIGAAVGALNAFLIRTARITPLIATLATFILLQGVALLWLEVPGGYISDVLLVDSAARVGFIPWAFLALIGVALVLEFAYRRSRAGLWFRATGSRPVAASRLGARSEMIQYVAYIASGVLGAVAGIFFAGTIGIGDPTLGVTFTLASISAVVLGGLSTWGGRGSFLGPLLGAVLLAEIANASGFLNMPAHTQLFVQGGLLLFAIGLYSRLRASGLQRYETIAR